MEKFPDTIKFDLTFSKKRRAWYALAHCPICGSSFSSGVWKRDRNLALSIATQSLHRHVAAYHSQVTKPA